jgi:hypothetical protein
MEARASGARYDLVRSKVTQGVDSAECTRNGGQQTSPLHQISPAAGGVCRCSRRLQGTTKTAKRAEGR